MFLRWSSIKPDGQLLQGIILRDAVLKLLQHHFGFLHSDLAGELPSAKSHIPTTQKVGPTRPFSNLKKTSRICHQDLADVQLQLRPQCQPQACTVHLTTSCSSTGRHSMCNAHLQAYGFQESPSISYSQRSSLPWYFVPYPFHRDLLSPGILSHQGLILWRAAVCPVTISVLA